MQHFIDLLLVGVALLVSTAYALYALGPKALRDRIAASIAAVAMRAAAMPGLRGPLQRLGARLAGTAPSACGGCGACATETAADADAGSAESRIPISKIGLRTRAGH